MHSFAAKIQIIGINPYVLLPPQVLNALFEQAGKNKGPVQVKGKLNGYSFKQTLVKYSGKWRLYLNTPMRTKAGIDVGDIADVKIEFDPVVRKTAMHGKLKAALDKNKKAAKVFNGLSPYKQKEIMRYIGNLKTEESVEKNITRALQFLLGKQRFIGREKP